MNTPRRTPIILAGSLLLGLFSLGIAAAQSRDPYPDTDSRDYNGEDVRQTVARISFLSGPVSFARGDEPDNWQAPDLNVPMTLGDRLYTGRGGRAELQIHGGAAIRLDAETDLSTLNLTDDTKQLSVNSGAAAFVIRRLDSEEVFEVDTPNSAVTFERIGDYRVDVDRDGSTRVAVRRGRAIVAAGGGQVTLNAGDEMRIDGIDDPRYDVAGIPSADRFDRWVADRENRIQRAKSRQYVNDEIVGVADLDDYGRWEDVPEYGRVWTPSSVEAGWAPYRVGHWVWQDPWGWTWVSGEPWGWAPYHYGRWVTSSSRWFWVPDAPRVAVRYSPALVAFVGGGPGFSATLRAGNPGYVGWFPLAPRDPFVPWWGRRSNVRTDNVRYVNRGYVTVVNQSAFVSGGLVARNVVTDRGVLRDVVSAPVLRGPLPVVPTAASLRVAVRTDVQAPQRPPAAILQRAVVARIAPPPAPPAFSAKVESIRENHGAPVTADAAARIVERRAPAPIVPIRPVVSEPGRMTLSPGHGAASGDRPAAAAQPVPVAPARGRPLATADRPYAAPNAPAPAHVDSAPAPPARGRPVAPPQTQPMPAAPEPPSERPRAVEPAPPAPAPPPARGNEDWRQRGRSGQVPPPTPENPPARGRVGEAPPPRPDSAPPPPRAIERERPAPPPTAAPAPNAPASRDLERPAAPPPAPAAPPSDRGRPRNPPPPDNAPPPRAPERERAVPAPTAPPAPPAAPPAAVDRGRGRDSAPPPPPPRDDGAARGRQAERERPAPAPAPPAAAPAAPAPPDRGRPAPEARPEEKPAKPSDKPNPKKEEKKDEKKKDENKKDDKPDKKE